MAKRGCVVAGIGLGCLGMLVLCGGGGVAIFSGITATLKQTDAYRDSIERVQASEEAKSELGEPITAGFFVSGSVSTSGGSGSADLSIPVSGPKRSGTIYVRGEKEKGMWIFSTMDLVVKGSNQHIDLLAESGEQNL